MNLKDQIELEMLRILARRIVELVDSHSTYDWRDDLKKDPGPMGFSLSSQADENLVEALEAALTDVGDLLKLTRQDLPTFH